MAPSSMSTFIRIAATLIVLLFPSAFSPNAAVSAETCPQKLESDSIARVRQLIKEKGLYSDWAKEGCLSFSVERCTAKTAEIAVQEVHSPECGGDPETSHTVDRFQVSADAGAVKRYDPVEDEYVAFDPPARSPKDPNR